MSLKFGTSGLRGLSVRLVGTASALYATAFAQHLLTRGLARPGDSVLVGRDFRDSSPSIATTCMSALKQAGLKPVDCGTIPTPALALYGLTLGAASLMVTGSHIPADRNGIKFYRPDGEIDKDDEVSITNFAAELKTKDWTFTEVPFQPENHQIQAETLFLDRNKALLPAGALKGLKIGVYQHSTVARDMFVEVLSHFGADVIALGRSASFIPVDTEAVSAETIDLLKQWTNEHNLDAIVSADGDGDRPLLSDEKGAPLRGDLIGLIAARFLKAGIVVTPVTSNSGIEKAGEFIVTRTRVGSPYVIAGMDAAKLDGQKNIMGFEANGGLLTATDFLVNGRIVRALPTRDSFLPCLSVLYAAKSDSLSLSGLAARYQLPYALSDRLESFATEKSTKLMENIRSSCESLERFLAPIGRPATISDIDGLRITLEDDRVIHFRPSGNAPEMRCYVEARTENEAQQLLKQGLAVLSEWSE